MPFQIIAKPAKPYHHELLGLLPFIFREDDPRPAAEQANDRYAHGGGWRPFEGFAYDPSDHSLTYPGDPAYRPFAKLRLPLSSETLLVYPYSWVAVLKDGEDVPQICRMD